MAPTGGQPLTGSRPRRLRVGTAADGTGANQVSWPSTNPLPSSLSEPGWQPGPLRERFGHVKGHLVAQNVIAGPGQFVGDGLARHHRIGFGLFALKKAANLRIEPDGKMGVIPRAVTWCSTPGASSRGPQRPLLPYSLPPRACRPHKLGTCEKPFLVTLRANAPGHRLPPQRGISRSSQTASGLQYGGTGSLGNGFRSHTREQYYCCHA